MTIDGDLRFRLSPSEVLGSWVDRYCTAISQSLPQIIQRHCVDRAPLGYEEELQALDLRSISKIAAMFHYGEQLFHDGDHVIGLFHRTPEYPPGIGAFMSLQHPFGRRDSHIHNEHLEHLFTRYPEIPLDSLCVTQLQGPLASFSKKHRSPLINPAHTNPHRIPWEKVFLDIAVDLARFMGEPRVYLLPAEYNTNFAKPEDVVRIYGNYAISSGMLKSQRALNKRLVKRYDITPQVLGWKRLESDGPWYMDTGIDG